jgi:hypothetical protein
MNGPLTPRGAARAVAATLALALAAGVSPAPGADIARFMLANLEGR